MTHYNLFEVILFGFLYFSMDEKNIIHIEEGEFPFASRFNCHYECADHIDSEKYRIINYVLEEAFN